MQVRPDIAQKREIIRDTVLDAAVREFARNGLRGGSIQTIAQEAGLSKAQLFYYFGSKDQLYEEALIHIVDIWQDFFLTGNFDQGPEVFFRSYIRRKLRLSLEHPEISQLYSNEIVQGAPFLRKYWHASKSTSQKAAAIIQKWIDAGLLRNVDPILLQFNIWGITQNYALHASQVRNLTGNENEPLDFDAITEQVTDLVLGGCLTSRRDPQVEPPGS
jgi:TetR/AcrR family transcriptional regulator